MKKYNIKIPLSKEYIKLIIQSIEEGEYLYNEQEKESPTITHNGKGGAIWNKINTQVQHNLPENKFLIDVVNRGVWQFIYIYDLETKYLYTLMRKDNYKNLVHKSNEKIFHYVNALSVLNGKLLGTYNIENEQLSFKLNDSFDEEKNDILTKSLSDMTCKLDTEIKRYCLILFSQQKGLVNRLEAKIPVVGFDSVYTENWNPYIEAQYVTEFIPIEPTQPNETEILLYCRQEYDIQNDKKNDTLDEVPNLTQIDQKERHKK